MKTVRRLHLKNFTPVIEHIDAAWIRCSVLGEYRPVEEFTRDGVQVRTNCLAAYRMKLADMHAATRQMEAAERSAQWQMLSAQLQAENRMRAQDVDMNASCVMVEDLINQLQALPPTSKVVLSCNYHYEGSEHVDFETPIVVHFKDDVYTLGGFRGGE